jgi:pimeloyl-ACP methyl ester carboxylesterase
MIQKIDKKILLLLGSIFFIEGCSNIIANKILYPIPHTDNNITLQQPKYTYEEINISTVDNEILSGLQVYNHKDKDKDVLLFLHGNNDDISQITKSNRVLILLDEALDKNYDVLVVDYRGYGKSTGSPSPKGLNLDIQAIINYLNKDKYKNIYIYAQSIGGTSFLGALDDINSTNVKGVITEGAFLSYKQLSNTINISVPFTDYKDIEPFAPISVNKNITLPLLLIHSQEDEVVPYSQGKALAKHFKNAKHIQTTGNHLGYISSESDLKTIFEFYRIHQDYKAPLKILSIVTKENNNFKKNKK